MPVRGAGVRSDEVAEASVNGGAIAVGHPIGASGLCIGGGQGVAMVVARL